MRFTVLLAAMSAVSVYAGESPADLSPLRVSGRETPPLPAREPGTLRLSGQDHELSSALAGLPGVSLASRGPHGREPVLRGLGWERVRTEFNGLSLHGACPARMDPPASFLTPAMAGRVEVDLGSASVLHGPGGLGGRIRVNSDLDRDPAAPRAHLLQGRVQSGSNGDFAGASASGLMESSRGAAEISGGAGRQGDYKSGSGTRVPASRDTRDLGGRGAVRLQEDLFLNFALRRIEERDVDYPSLPMDSRSSDIDLFTLSTRWEAEGPSLRGLEMRLGLQRIEHLMDNRDRPNRGMTQAETPSTSDSLNGRLLSRWQAGGGELRLGADAARLEREATRTRRMTATGARFQDPIWPDLREDQTGLFAEWEAPLREDLRVRIGVRGDRVSSEAGNTSARIVPGPGAGPLRLGDAYTRFGESQSGRTSATDELVSGNVLLRQLLHADWALSLELSRIAASPNLSQRYDGFAARPGGYGLGNPDLEPEVKHQIELRLEGQAGPHRLGAAVYAARVDDYVLPTLIGRQDISGDGRPDAVYSHRNVDAALYGFELAGEFRLSGSWFLPLQLAFVRGGPRDGGSLPEMPPMEGLAALRWERESFVELGLGFAGRQDRIDAGYGEKESPGYAVAHLRFGAPLRPGLWFEAGVENLFDTEYAQHLTRHAVMEGGGLRPGDRVPEPGRSLTLALRGEW